MSMSLDPISLFFINECSRFALHLVYRFLSVLWIVYMENLSLEGVRSSSMLKAFCICLQQPNIGNFIELSFHLHICAIHTITYYIQLLKLWNIF